MARTNARSTPPATQTTPPPQARTAANTATASTGPTHEQIARRAYELYLARGATDGQAEQDWVQAERELRLGR
jgi:Protein of unknown function (DUF2934)